MISFSCVAAYYDILHTVTLWHLPYLTNLTHTTKLPSRAGMESAMSLPCSACAAVGRALLSSHHGAEQKSCLAARTPLRAVCCFRRIRHPLASGASSWFRGSRWRVFGQSSNSECRVTQTDVTLQSYNYQDGFLQQQDAGHPSAGEARRAVGPNHARWLSSITNSCRMGHKTWWQRRKCLP